MSKLFNKGKSLTVTKFAKRLNYPRASNREFKRILRILEANEYVVVQQGGFLGDNIHHNIIVTVLKPLDLDRFKRVILTEVNYNIGEYTVHRSKESRKCEKCKHSISVGERYGSKIKIGKKPTFGKPHIIFLSIVCLPCLLERQTLEELMEIVNMDADSNMSVGGID